MKVQFFLSLLVAPLLVTSTALAQVEAPSTESMIEQLKSKPARKTRGLVVERAPEQPTTQSTPTPIQPTTINTTQPPTVAAIIASPAAPQTPTPTPTPIIQPAVSISAATETTEQAAEAADTGKAELSLQIFFDFNSARVKPESQVSLARLAEALQSEALVKSRFLVEGHTDAKGNPGANLMLSWQRADAVSNYLVRKGVSKSRLQAIGKGSTELANALSPDSSENRRVKIINLD